MDKEDTEQPSAVRLVRQMMMDAREEGSELVELNVNTAMYRALVDECHPLSPSEALGIPVREDRDLDEPEDTGPMVH